ncbi:MAG: hypothetical protein C4295_05870 [Candidatus Fervidibacterota bacterium]
MMEKVILRWFLGLIGLLIAIIYFLIAWKERNEKERAVDLSMSLMTISLSLMLIFDPFLTTSRIVIIIIIFTLNFIGLLIKLMDC